MPRNRLLAYLLFLTLLLIQVHASTVHAQASTLNVVKVGIYVLQIGKFDLSSGSYTVDFYLSMTCNGKCNLGSFEFMDGRADNIVVIENTTNAKFYRIEGTFFENLDLQKYPFDSHNLKIEIEDTTLTTQNLVYTPDPSNSGLDPRVIIVGWDVVGWNASVVDHFYPPYNQTYSRYIFSVTLNRPGLTSGLNMFLPVFFVVFIALISMLLVGSRLESRILLTVTALLAAVFFQFTLDSTLPPLGYLTFADKFMIATYVIIVATLAVSILLLKYNDKKDTVKAAKIQYYTVRIMPIVTILIYAYTFLSFR
jgi:hypothetical protein